MIRIKLLLTIVLASCLAPPLASRAAEDGSQRPTLAVLTPKLRQEIDALALKTPKPGLHAAGVDFSGNIVAWLISQARLSPQEEAQAAAKNHENLLRQFRAVPTPPQAAKVFSQLLAAVPPHLKPEAFTYRLTVLESDALEATTVGGGYVYITQPLVEGLLADRQRGGAALALTLAAQLGHIGLEHCRRGYQLAELEEEAHGGRPLPIDDQTLRRAGRPASSGAIPASVSCISATRSMKRTCSPCTFAAMPASTSMLRSTHCGGASGSKIPSCCRPSRRRPTRRMPTHRWKIISALRRNWRSDSSDCCAKTRAAWRTRPASACLTSTWLQES